MNGRMELWEKWDARCVWLSSPLPRVGFILQDIGNMKTFVSILKLLCFSQIVYVGLQINLYKYLPDSVTRVDSCCLFLLQSTKLDLIHKMSSTPADHLWCLDGCRQEMVILQEDFEVLPRVRNRSWLGNMVVCFHVGSSFMRQTVRC